MEGLDKVLIALLIAIITTGLEASCGPGQFGDSCRYSCNCQECDQVTGACPGSCIAGWVKGGQLCQKDNRRIANSSIYLDGDQSRVCYTFPASVQDNPTDVVCDAVTRRLTIENPGTGIVGNTPLNICEVEIYKCSAGTYGENCTNFCHCGDCDVRTGVCTGNCFEGWKGDSCDIACADTTYGINCVKGCQSRNCSPGSSSCDRFTGRCDKGCLPGWHGIDCTQQCDKRHYGQNCLKICAERNCYGTSDCNHVTGLCDSGCKQGWMGIDCKQECDNTYGFNCNKTCGDRKCAGDMEPCDRLIGSCTPCLPGWQGVDCTEECDNLHYGLNCSRQCKSRHCTDIDSSCNHVSGRCDQGCLPGWRGDDCIQGVSDTAESTTTDIRTIALSTTVGVLVVIIVILTLVIIRMKRRQHSSGKTSEGDNTTVPGPNPTPYPIHTEMTPSDTNRLSTLANYECFQFTEDNHYT